MDCRHTFFLVSNCRFGHIGNFSNRILCSKSHWEKSAAYLVTSTQWFMTKLLEQCWVTYLWAWLSPLWMLAKLLICMGWMKWGALHLSHCTLLHSSVNHSAPRHNTRTYSRAWKSLWAGPIWWERLHSRSSTCAIQLQSILCLFLELQLPWGPVPWWQGVQPCYQGMPRSTGCRLHWFVI